MMEKSELRVKGIAQKVEKELELDQIKGRHEAGVEVHTMRQGDLTADCWPVQFQGLRACLNCEYRMKPDCGGGASLLNLIAAKVIDRWGSL